MRTRKNLPCAHFFLYQTSCPVNKIYINWGIWNEDHTFSPSGMRVSKLFYNYSVILPLMSIETDALHSILCQQCLIFISQPYKVDCSDIPLKFLAMKKESSFNLAHALCWDSGRTKPKKNRCYAIQIEVFLCRQLLRQNNLYSQDLSR